LTHPVRYTSRVTELVTAHMYGAHVVGRSIVNIGLLPPALSHTHSTLYQPTMNIDQAILAI